MTSFRNLLAALGCAIALIAVMKPASAATIGYYDVTFSATDFFSIAPVSPPLTSVSGEFHLLLTPGVTSSGSLSYNSIQAPLLAAADYSYAGLDDTLQVFNAETSLTILNFTTNPTFLTFSYLYGGVITFSSFNGLVEVTATPIPAALPLFAAAVAGLGFAGWRRRKTVAA